MIPGGGSRLTEQQMLDQKRAIDSHRKAQAILRRRHAAKQAIARITAANQRASA